MINIIIDRSRMLLAPAVLLRGGAESPGLLDSPLAAPPPPEAPAQTEGGRRPQPPPRRPSCLSVRTCLMSSCLSEAVPHQGGWARRGIATGGRGVLRGGVGRGSIPSLAVVKTALQRKCRCETQPGVSGLKPTVGLTWIQLDSSCTASPAACSLQDKLQDKTSCKLQAPSSKLQRAATSCDSTGTRRAPLFQRPRERRKLRNAQEGGGPPQPEPHPEPCALIGGSDGRGEASGGRGGGRKR